jgi:hypothetical protein
MVKKDQLLRIDFETDLQLPMDDCSIIEDLISRADKMFTYYSKEINDFFN